LLEIWLSLIKDDFDSVRISAIEVSYNIITRMEKNNLINVI